MKAAEWQDEMHQKSLQQNSQASHQVLINSRYTIAFPPQNNLSLLGKVQIVGGFDFSSWCSNLSGITNSLW